MDESDEPEISQGRQILGFSLSFIISVVLTVIAVPLLFNAVCMPTGYWGKSWLDPAVVFIVYALAAIIGAFVILARTENRGVRWGCGMAIVVVAGTLLYIFYK